MLLTGGPGTGKTTVIKGIVELYAEIHGLSLDYDDYNEDDYPVVLAAPTGRASKRLQESTGLEAMTIHRLIGWNQETQPEDILDNEINARLIIIDEMSMVDTWLFHQFLSAVPLDAQIVFVGDEDQLLQLDRVKCLKTSLILKEFRVLILRKCIANRMAQVLLI